MATNTGNKNVGVSKEVMSAMKRFEQCLSTKPIEEQIAVSLISKNVLNGCSWEFTRQNPEIKRNLEAFKKSEVCSVQEVTYNHEKKVCGYLVYMQMSYLCSLLGPKYSGPLNEKDLKIATDHREEAQLGLAKKMKAGYTGNIGIYCTNDSQSITVDGNTFPAYAVTLRELCTICKQLRYGILINGAVRNPDDVIAREDAVLRSLTVAPSSNALFIKIAPMKR